MSRHYALLLCVLLFANCEKPKVVNTNHKESPLTTMRSARAKRAGQSVSAETLRAPTRGTGRNNSRKVVESESAALAWNALEIDFESAGEMIRSLSADHPEKMRLVLHYAMILADREPDEAITWSASLGSEVEIAAAKGQVAVAMAEFDPWGAASLLSDSGVESHECDVAIVQVLQRWSALSPADAAAWTASFPTGAIRKSGLGIIIPQWAKSDPAAAFTWMHTLRDEAIQEEAAFAMEVALLQQSDEVREIWLQYADSETRADLEAQCELAMTEIGSRVETEFERPISIEIPSAE
jgi:hypothetical protein